MPLDKLFEHKFPPESPIEDFEIPNPDPSTAQNYKNDENLQPPANTNNSSNPSKNPETNSQNSKTPAETQQHPNQQDDEGDEYEDLEIDDDSDDNFHVNLANDYEDIDTEEILQHEIDLIQAMEKSTEKPPSTSKTPEIALPETEKNSEKTDPKNPINPIRTQNQDSMTTNILIIQAPEDKVNTSNIFGSQESLQLKTFLAILIVLLIVCWCVTNLKRSEVDSKKGNQNEEKNSAAEDKTLIERNSRVENSE